MDFDEIVKHLGDFGRYQKFLYALICVSSLFIGTFDVIPAFFLAVPNHRCKIPNFENDTYNIQSDLHREFINKYIPPSSDETLDYDQCHFYIIPSNSSQVENSSQLDNGTLEKCNEWVYSDAIFYETFTSKHGLVCDNGYKTSLAMSLMFVGVLVAGLVIGILGDIFGRKKAFLVSSTMFFVYSLGLAFSINFISFAVCMFFMGLSSSGTYDTGFVMGLELAGPSKRIFTGIVVGYFHALGLVMLVGISYLVRHWKYIAIICAAPLCLLLSYWCLLPESPRWLVAKQRDAEARKILQKAAKINRVVLPNYLFEKQAHEEPKDGTLWQLFTSRILLLRSLVIFFNWFAINMTYYGLSLYSGDLDGNYYFNFFLSGLVEFPAYTLALMLLDRVGRKRLHCLCMILGGIACVSTIFTILYLEESYQPFTVVLAMLGKLGVAAAYGIIYMYGAELFPTVVRNAGLGASSCVGQLGSVAAPYINYWGSHIGGKVGQALPLVVYGLFSITAGALALYLPETLNQKLPETIEDGIKFGTNEYKTRQNNHETTVRHLNGPVDVTTVPGNEENTELPPITRLLQCE